MNARTAIEIELRKVAEAVAEIQHAANIIESAAEGQITREQLQELARRIRANAEKIA